MNMRVSLRVFSTLALVLLLGTSLPGCDGDSPTTITIEQRPEADKVTEMFAGSISLDSTSCHNFTQIAFGDVQLTIKSLEPLGTLTVGMGIGQADETQETGCALFATDNNVRVDESLTSSSNDVGEYCTCVYDVGNIFPDVTVSYTVEVEHT